MTDDDDTLLRAIRLLCSMIADSTMRQAILSAITARNLLSTR
jgi:hypothetical protein